MLGAAFEISWYADPDMFYVDKIVRWLRFVDDLSSLFFCFSSNLKIELLYCSIAIIIYSI